MSLFKKIGKGLKKATKATGKGLKKAAKYTVKHPLKVIAPVAGVAATVATAGAIAPGLATKLAATKVGKTVFGKMVTKTMGTGTIVRNKIANTLKKQGKKANKKDIDQVQEGLQAEITKRKGHRLPVDKTSKTGTEARAKLKKISSDLTNAITGTPEEQTINAERSILSASGLSGLLNRSDVSDDTYSDMEQAGDIKQNLLGNAISNIGSALGLSTATQVKAKNAIDILTGQDTDAYFDEDMNEGVQAIEAKQNQASVFDFDGLKEKLSNWAQKPVFWVILIGAAAASFYYANKKSTKPKKRK